MQMTFWEAVKNRRSIYGFSGEEPVAPGRIEQIAADALTHVPSAFNSQSTRLVLLFGEHHARLWRIALDALRAVVPAEQFPETEQKINGQFASGYGTVLFFEDQAVVDELMADFPLYAHNFPVWSQHTSAMHQFVVWTALEAEGLGASLQHYSPLIDDAAAKAWNIPGTWKLVAQMPFGAPAEPADEKEFSPLDERLKVYK